MQKYKSIKYLSLWEYSLLIDVYLIFNLDSRTLHYNQYNAGMLEFNPELLRVYPRIVTQMSKKNYHEENPSFFKILVGKNSAILLCDDSSTGFK